MITRKTAIYYPKDKLNMFINFIISSSISDEEWKELDIGDGYYFISTYGRVLSLYHNYPLVLKPFLSNGYQYVTIDGKHRRVNRLVAKAFLENPDMLPVAHHKDGNKTNNKLSNIQWTTYSNNTKEYYKQKYNNQEKEEKRR